MELKKNNVVVLANGKVGVVDEVFGQPLLVVFKAFTTPINRWDDNGNHKNGQYSVVKVYDGEPLMGTDPNKNIYRSTYNFEELPVLWERA